MLSVRSCCLVTEAQKGCIRNKIFFSTKYSGVIPTIFFRTFRRGQSPPYLLYLSTDHGGARLWGHTVPLFIEWIFTVQFLHEKPVADKSVNEHFAPFFLVTRPGYMEFKKEESMSSMFLYFTRNTPALSSRIAIASLQVTSVRQILICRSVRQKWKTHQCSLCLGLEA